MEELIPITMFMCIAAVMILRPITKRMGALLEAMTRERLQTPAPGSVSEQQLNRVTALLEQIARRQEIMEERLDFTERLLGSGRRGQGSTTAEPAGPFDDLRLGPEPVTGAGR
ncbi:MAG: hypothetical protein FIB01_12515 [Gemmatimonadetes bacterium]|nr:hypothetical protein [Gemmatimonadota bacterium]